MVKDIENKEMCAKCGGACCKNFGCMYMPSDFKSMDFKYLKNRLTQNNISIGGQIQPTNKNDEWTFVLFLHARNEGAKIVDLVSKGGPCKNLTPTGCKIKDRSKRPSSGLSVRPIKIGGPCVSTITNDELGAAWQEHQEVLKELVKYFDDDIEIVLERQRREFMNHLIKQKLRREPMTGAQEKTLQRIDFIAGKRYIDVCDYIERETKNDGTNLFK